MTEVRSIFLATGRVALDQISSGKIAEGWDGPSALREFPLHALVGHLVRGVGSVEAYLDREEPVGTEPISAAAYYRAAVGDDVDIYSGLHVAVRARGAEAARAGNDAVIRDLDSMLTRLDRRLVDEPLERLVRVFKDLVLRLDDYLVTRIVELVVHIDDIAASIGSATPGLPPRAAGIAIRNLVDVARVRHGDLAVVRALTRRERDEVEALRVL